jgi:hypothetical protein
MRNAKAITMLLAMGLAFSGPLVAHAKKVGGGGESQKGGLPALEDRVDAADALITSLQGKVQDLQGQNNWAVVKADGTLIRSSSLPGPVAVVHTASTGLYEVDFGKDVTGCAYTATLGDTGTSTPPIGFVGVATDGDADGVTVLTTNNLGVLADEPFHLYVSCP